MVGWFLSTISDNARRKTHVAQKLPTDKVTKLNQFHQYLNYIRRVGKYQLCDLANMDQTPLPFILDGGQQHMITGVPKMFAAFRVRQFLRNVKQQLKLLYLLMVFPRIKPLIIFKGKGLRISPDEKKAWDSRVTIFFQKKRLCDEEVMIKWIKTKWNNFFLQPTDTRFGWKDTGGRYSSSTTD